MWLWLHFVPRFESQSDQTTYAAKHCANEIRTYEYYTYYWQYEHSVPQVRECAGAWNMAKPNDTTMKPVARPTNMLSTCTSNMFVPAWSTFCIEIIEAAIVPEPAIIDITIAVKGFSWGITLACSAMAINLNPSHGILYCWQIIWFKNLIYTTR